jgi:23S rRNA (cytosine1962-C5)-methyltransferase
VLLNGFDPAHHSALDADVNGTLRQMLKDGRQFDAIVLDPPKFAPAPPMPTGPAAPTRTSTAWA